MLIAKFQKSAERESVAKALEMVRIVKEHSRQKQQWIKHRYTLSGIQIQLGIVGVDCTANEHRKYDNDRRVQTSLQHRLECFYWAQIVESLGIAIRKDYQNARIQYMNMPMSQKIEIIRLAQRKALKYRLSMMEHMHYERFSETGDSINSEK